MQDFFFLMNVSKKTALRKYKRQCLKNLHSITKSVALSLVDKIPHLPVMWKGQCVLSVVQMDCSQQDNIKIKNIRKQIAKYQTCQR